MKTTFDITKVSYAQFCFINQEGSIRLNLPTVPTVRGEVLVPNTIARFHPDYPGETMFERAKRLDIIDRWTPYLRLQFSNTHVLAYTGKKAITLWEVWNAHVFGKRKK